jgi:hypothetical protein
MTIDLSGGDESPVQAAGRVVGAIVLMILGGVVVLVFVAGWLIGPFIPAISDPTTALDDLLLIPAGIGLSIAVGGFELVRRTRTVRAAEAVEAAAIMERLRAERAASKPAAGGSSGDAAGAETHL